jgi:hypothetical protein
MRGRTSQGLNRQSAHVWSWLSRQHTRQRSHSSGMLSAGRTSHCLNGDGTSQRPQVSVADPGVGRLHGLKQVARNGQARIGAVIRLGGEPAADTRCGPRVLL